MFRDWGKDQYGLWMALTYKNVRQIMRWITPGTFTMGSPETEEGRFESELEHQVVISNGFWLADTACTQELWQLVMGQNPSEFKEKKRPVESVSWNHCTDFINRLNNYLPQWKFYLPTEAQWEYACRAGTTNTFNFGDSATKSLINYDSDDATVPVKSLPCNEWGLYEMHGNVYEWCSDWFGEYERDILDPLGRSDGMYRVLRGGSWECYSSWHVRSAYRFSLEPSAIENDIGFRFCLSQK